jgi:hypothetical protein
LLLRIFEPYCVCKMNLKSMAYLPETLHRLCLLGKERCHSRKYMFMWYKFLPHYLLSFYDAHEKAQKQNSLLQFQQIKNRIILYFIQLRNITRDWFFEIYCTLIKLLMLLSPEPRALAKKFSRKIISPLKQLQILLKTYNDWLVVIQLGKLKLDTKCHGNDPESRLAHDA